MHSRSLCFLTAAALALSTALAGCGGSSSGSQSLEKEQTQETTDDSADKGSTQTEASAEAVSTPEPEPQPEPEPIPEPEPEPELPRSPMTGKVMDEELLKQRPLAVMYPINKQAQPQYGLDRVDVFYEIMEEGDMSRQMGILQDWQGLDRIGNIRSIRSYFVYEALEWDPIIIHFGGPVDWVADDLTREDVDNINGVGGVMGSDYGAFYRIPHDGVALEHTAYTDSDHINDAIDEAGFEREHRDVDATYIDMAGSYPVTRSALYYDPEDKLYYKTLYGEDQCDGATGEQLSFTNVFIQRCSWEHCADGTSKYLWFRIEEPDPEYDDGFYITNGKMIHVTWDKADDYEPTLFYDDNGKEVTVNQGRTMIFIIRDDCDTFEIDDIYYDTDDHQTLDPALFEEDSSEESTHEEAAPVEEPEEEEW